jgi:hypothetical protein
MDAAGHAPSIAIRAMDPEELEDPADTQPLLKPPRLKRIRHPLLPLPKINNRRRPNRMRVTHRECRVAEIAGGTAQISAPIASAKSAMSVRALMPRDMTGIGKTATKRGKKRRIRTRLLPSWRRSRHSSKPKRRSAVNGVGS